METIELEVDPETARRYRAAGPEERREAARAVSERLGCGGSRREAVRRLMETMDRAGREAEDRGLTPEILAQILADE